LPAGSIVVGGDWAAFTKSFRVDDRGWDLLLQQRRPDGFGAPVGQSLIVVIAAHAIGVSFDLTGRRFSRTSKGAMDLESAPDDS
jgi:hypothetical protein